LSENVEKSEAESTKDEEISVPHNTLVNHKREGELPVGDVPTLKALSECLTERQRREIKLTPKEIGKLVSEMNEKAYWGPAAALPMLCLGPKCCIASGCSLQQIGRAPVGSRCPLELLMINRWKDDYLNDLGASWENKIERQAIMDLVETEIFRHRANGIVAAEGFVMENTIGMNPDTGAEITTKMKHIALEVSDQLSRRQERLLKSLIATREMKEKLGKTKGDQSRKESDLIEKVRAVIAKEKKGAEVIHEGEIIEPSGKKNAGTPEGAAAPAKDSGAGPGPGGTSK